MLMVRASRPREVCIKAGILSESLFKSKAPLVESWSPPPISFQEPMRHGSMVTARMAMPPPSERWMP